MWTPGDGGPVGGTNLSRLSGSFTFGQLLEFSYSTVPPGALPPLIPSSSSGREGRVLGLVGSKRGRPVPEVGLVDLGVQDSGRDGV